MKMDRLKSTMKKWYMLGAAGVLLTALACGPISARDAQGVLDTGREIQRLQQEEITPRLDSIAALQEEIEPLESRLREIKKEFREIERESIRPLEEEFQDFDDGPDRGIMRGLEEEFQAKMRAIDDAQRELQHEQRSIESAFQDESRAFDESFQDSENDKSDRMRKLDEELRELYQGREDDIRELYDDAEKIEKKMGRIDWNDPEDAEKAEELEDELRDIYDSIRDVEDENRRRIEELEDERFAMEDDSWDTRQEMQDFFDDLEERMRDEFEAVEDRRMELDEERWALDEEMRQKFDEAENMFREQRKEANQQFATVFDDQIRPLKDEMLGLEDQLEELYSREHALQKELATFSREIEPLRQNMETSMLDLLDTAIQAAQSNPIVFADDGG